LQISGGLGGGLSLNYNHNVHKYHKHRRRFNKSEDLNVNNKKEVKESRGGSQSFDLYESLKASTMTKSIKIIPNSIAGGDSPMFDDIFALNNRGRRRAMSSESISTPSLTPTSRSKPIQFSKDDSFFSHFAGRHKGNSPKMAHHLFDLKNMNEFIHTKDAISVVTNSFTAIHDDHFKFVENHF